MGTATGPTGGLGRAARSTGERIDSEGREQRLGQPVSVVIPTYNESKNIERVIARCQAALIGRPFELVIVDDDSPDGTWQLVDERYRGDKRVRVVRRTGERGLATAVSTGVGVASYDYCVIIDADLQHPPETIPLLVAALEDGADIAIASRYVPRGRIENWSRYRRLVSRGALVLTKLFIPQTRGVADPLSGFFALKRDLIADVTLAPMGYKILLELLARCAYTNVVEVPYVFHQRENGDSKLSGREYLHFLEHVGHLVRWAHTHPRPT